MGFSSKICWMRLSEVKARVVNLGFSIYSDHVMWYNQFTKT